MNLDKFIAKNHAIKLDDDNENKSLLYKIRSYTFEKFGIWEFLDIFPYSWRMTYWEKIKPIFKPQNKRLRKFIPRTWKDMSHLMVDLNFEMIKVFYEDEYKAGIVDWESDQPHRDFSKWIENSYFYITKARPKLEIDLENSYPPSKPMEEMFEHIPQEDGTTRIYLKDDGIPYEIKYAEVNRIEKLIEETDTKILKEFIEYRHFFWT
jgi:hypothetical protein